MARGWIYKTNEAGKPRRFLNRREAAVWAGLTVGKPVGVIAFYVLLNAAIDAYRGADAWRSSFVVALAVVWGAIWLGVSLALYVYVALSGGVMDEEARHRYRNNETVRFW